jgi:hypothetical protein
VWRPRLPSTPDPSPLEAAARWRHDPTSDVPGRVRRALATQLRQWDLRGIDQDDVALVLTELVTNAVEHARTPLTVTVDLLLTSANAGAGENKRQRRSCSGAADRGHRRQYPPAAAAPSEPEGCSRPGTADGRSTHHRLGHTLTAIGKTVWAELAPGTLSVASPP